jgi:hypothetical protein
MSNTLRKKKLASFNCDQKMWEQFIDRCQSKGTTATATLTRFIELYLDGSLDDLDAIVRNDLDKTLDSRIKASVEQYLAASQSSSDNPTSETISTICSRLSELESQREGKYHSADLDEKIEGITARMTQLAEAIVKIQNYLNNQPRQRNKSYSNNSYNQRSTPRIQPLTEEGLAARLSVNAETIRSERVNLPSPLFVAWCKSKDRAGLGWEFNQNTGLYHPVS